MHPISALSGIKKKMSQFLNTDIVLRKQYNSNSEKEVLCVGISMTQSLFFSGIIISELIIYFAILNNPSEILIFGVQLGSISTQSDGVITSLSR